MRFVSILLIFLLLISFSFADYWANKQQPNDGDYCPGSNTWTNDEYCGDFWGGYNGNGCACKIGTNGDWVELWCCDDYSDDGRDVCKRGNKSYSSVTVDVGGSIGSKTCSVTCTTHTYYRDADGDGYGKASTTSVACSAPSGYVSNSQDCNDSSSAIKPGATEVCDGVDNDCDGSIDENPVIETFTYVPKSWWTADSSFVVKESEKNCGVASSNIIDGWNFPQNVCYNDGQFSTWVNSASKYYLMIKPNFSSSAFYSISSMDIDLFFDPREGTDTINLKYGIFKGGLTSSANTFSKIIGVAGGGAAKTDKFTISGSGWTSNDLISSKLFMVMENYERDFDDKGLNYIKLTVTGNTCFPTPVNWYRDFDADGYGDLANRISAVFRPVGYVADSSDCDDTSNLVNPGAVEVCEGRDNDCDRSVDEGCPFGYLDSASCEMGLVGWARDSRNVDGTGIIDDAVALSNDLNVHFYYVSGDGPASTTNIYLGEVLANLDSSDVGAHRFNKQIIVLDAEVGEKYTFGVWGINVGNFSIGNPPLTNNKTLTINSEVCDGLDNDCDGLIDEGLDEVSSGCNQIGVCSGAVRSCVDGDWSVCSIVPSEEVCDYLDNDCDGVVDNALDCLAVPCFNCSSLESLINVDTLGVVSTSDNIVLDLNISCDFSDIDNTKSINVNSVFVKKNDELVNAVLSDPVLDCNIIPARRQVVVGDCDELNYVVSFGFDANEPYCFDANNCVGLDKVLSVIDCASSDFKWNGKTIPTIVVGVSDGQNIPDGSIYSALIIILGIFFLTTKKKE